MKILHTSDLHIGKSRKLPGYLDRQRKMLEEIYRIFVERELEAVLVSGDIFESKHIFPEEKDMFTEWLLRMDAHASKVGAKIIIQDGNHDLITEGYTHLRLYTIMRHLLKSTEIVEINPKILRLSDNIIVGVVPARYYDTEGLNAVINVLYEKANKEMWGGHGSSEKHPDLFFIAMVHECILGSVNSLGWMADKGPQLDPSIPVDYYALGDIHKSQHVSDMPHAWYSGSPIQHDFGDADERGILVVDTDKPTDPEFVELQGVTKLVTVSEIPDEWPEGDLVRVEATARQLSEAQLPENVVATKPVVDEQQAINTLQNDDLLRDLPSILAEMGLDQGEQRDAVEIAREKRLKVG